MDNSTNSTESTESKFYKYFKRAIIFILIFYYALKNSWNLFSRIKSDPVVLVGPTMLMIYIIDSNLNFPFTRASQLFYLSFVLALSLYYKKYYNEINK